MNLRNGNITVREILSNPKAKQLLMTELSGYVNPQMLSFASGMTLNNVLVFAKGRVAQNKVDDLLAKLKEI